MTFSLLVNADTKMVMLVVSFDDSGKLFRHEMPQITARELRDQLTIALARLEN